MKGRFKLEIGEVIGDRYIFIVQYTGKYGSVEKSLCRSLHVLPSREDGLTVEDIAKFRIKTANRGLRYIDRFAYSTLDRLFDDSFCHGIKDLTREIRSYADKGLAFARELCSKPMPDYSPSRA